MEIIMVCCGLQLQRCRIISEMPKSRWSKTFWLWKGNCHFANIKCILHKFYSLFLFLVKYWLFGQRLARANGIHWRNKVKIKAGNRKQKGPKPLYCLNYYSSDFCCQYTYHYMYSNDHIFDVAPFASVGPPFLVAHRWLFPPVVGINTSLEEDGQRKALFTSHNFIEKKVKYTSLSTTSTSVWERRLKKSTSILPNIFEQYFYL